MSDGYESTCPLCNTPRAKGQKRCICNYTFEYERESRPFRRVSKGSAMPVSMMSLAVLACAGVAGAVAFWWMMSLTPPPAADSTKGVVLAVAGLFAVAGAFFDWGFFMRARRASLVVAIFTRGGARLIYAVIGGALAGAGTTFFLS